MTPESSPAGCAALAAGGWFALFVGFHVLALHLLSPSNRARILMVTYGICCLGLIVTIGMVLGGTTGQLLGAVFGVMTMGCLFVLYVPMYYVVSNSLSVQSIILLLNSNGSLTCDELYRRFASHELLEGRLRALVQSGYVVTDGAAFRISQRGRSLIAPFLMLKSLWKLGAGG